MCDESKCLYFVARQNVLCDVQLEAEGVEIPAHRVVLAACSSYFNAMFTGELSESRAHKILLQEVDGKALGLLIDFVYTSEIQVTEENVQVSMHLGQSCVSPVILYTLE